MNGIDRNIVIIEGEKDCSEYLMWKLLSETEFVGIDNIVCARSYKGIINNLNLIRDILFRYRVSARVLVCYDTTGYKKLVDRLKNLVDAWKPITPEQCVRVVRDDTRSQLNSLLNQLRTDCTRYKVHELVEKSPMLKRLKDENPWLCWTTSNKKQ